METRGAFPGWLNRLWWVLLPGVLIVTVSILGVTGYLMSRVSDDRATGLAAVGGGGASLLLSWLVVCLALMHLWFLVAACFALRRRAQLRRQEEWKLAGTGVVLLAVYSPLIAMVVVRMF
ncbi:MAG: hypothetical protein ACRD2Q_08335 [Terriglobales bacterium]